MESYYQKDIECMDEKRLHDIQEDRLKKQVRHVYDNVAAYREKMDAAGVCPDDIKTLDDLSKLPFTEKKDLRDNYPDGFLAVDTEECVRIQSTSGTTGRRVIAYYTKEDIDLWEDCCARAIVAAGGSKKDVCQVSYGYGLFTGGPGLNGGSHKVGCLTIPASSGNTDRQIMFIRDLEATILCCTPSYAAYMGERMKEMGLTADEIPLKKGIFGAEPWSAEMKADIESTLGIESFNIYGLTELSGPGVSFECTAHDGMHINEDHFIAEVIDPKTGEVLPDGEKGELVFTSITKRAFPLIRYRTRDICILSRKKCKCGRTHVRMTPPMGRTDDMLIVRGVNVFPTQIETVLMNEGYAANYLIIVDRVNNSDLLEVQVEMTEEKFTDDIGEIAKLQRELQSALHSMLGIKVDVKLVAPKSIARSEGKAVRVIDKRKNK